jgi:hypothetical protein
MGQQTEKILLELKLNADQLKTELGSSRDKIQEFRTQNRALQKELVEMAAAGLKGTDAYNAQLQLIGDNERQIIALNREAQQLNKNLDSVEAAAGSYNELAATTAFLEKQLKEAVVGVNITADAYEKLAQKVSDGYQAQRDFSRNISNNNRELVGSYAESLAPALDEVKGKLDVANDSVVAIGKQLAELKNQRAVLSPTSDEAKQLTAQIAALDEQLATAKKQLDATGEEAKVAAGSLAAMRAELDALYKKRENATGDDLKKLNGDILGLKGSIGEAEGRFDEFGDRIEKNAKKEDIATLSDAFGGVAASINVATVLLGDNENATKAAAVATKALVVAQSLRQIQIGIASAADAYDIIVTKAKNLLLRESAVVEGELTTATAAHAVAAGGEAAATEASAAATGEAVVATEAHVEAVVADTVATEANAEAHVAAAGAIEAGAVASAAGAEASTAAAAASVGQAAAAESAAVATEAVSTALRLSPIGLIITAVLLLIGAFTAYGKASDSTKAKVNSFAEALLRYTNPLGLLYTGLETLYNKFESVRKVLDPVIEGFEKVFSVIKSEAISLGQSIGLIDTAAEAALKAQQKLAKSVEERSGLFAAEAKLLELNNAKLAEYRSKEREGIVASYNVERDGLNAMKALRAERAAAGDKLNEKELSALTAQAVKVKQLAVTLGEFDKATTETLLGNQRARLAALAGSLDAQLEITRAGSAQELALNKQKLALGYEAAITVYKQTDEERKAIDDKYRADVAALDRNFLQASRAARLGNEATYLAAKLETVKLGGAAELAVEKAQLLNQRNQSLNNYNLSAADRKAINAKYRADELVLETSFARAVAVADLNNAKSLNNAKLAEAGLGAAEVYALQLKQIQLDEQLELAALDRRRNNADKEVEIRANAAAKIRALDLANLQAANDRAQQQRELDKASIDAAVNLMGAGLDEGQKRQLAASAGFYNARRAQIFAGAATELSAINATEKERLLAAGSNAEERVRIEAEAAQRRKILEQNLSAELLDLDRDTNEQRKQLTVDRINAVGSLTTTALGDLSTIVDAQAQGEASRRDARMNAELASVGNNAAQQKVIRDKYAKMQQRDEAEAAEKRRKIQIAQALVNAGLAITQILSAPAAPFVEPFASIVRGVQIGLVVATTATQIANMKAQKFAEGGVVSGPSHAAGGVQLFHKTGAHLGEMEGDETILVPGVAKSPILRRLASTLNVLAGGRAFAGSLGNTSTTFGGLAKFAAGGVVTFDPNLANGRSGGAQAGTSIVDYDRLAETLAPVLTAAVAALPPSNVVWSEFEEAGRKATHTEQQASN